jgi:hypothetical protein
VLASRQRRGAIGAHMVHRVAAVNPSKCGDIADKQANEPARDTSATAKAAGLCPAVVGTRGFSMGAYISLLAGLLLLAAAYSGVFAG